MTTVNEATVNEVTELEALRRKVAELELQLGIARQALSREGFGGPGTAGARDLGEGVLVGYEGKALPDTAPNLGTWMWDLATDEITWSPEFYRILGYEPGQITPSSEAYWATVHPDDLNRVRAIAQRGIDTGAAAPSAFRLLQPDGEVRHVVTDAAPVKGEDGAVQAFVGTLLDLTEPKLAEKRLRRSEHLLKEAQRLARVGSWTWDPGHDEILWSDAMYEICGVDLGVTPTVELYLGLLHPDDRASVESKLEDALGESEVATSEHRLVRLSDDSTCHVQAVTRTVRDVTGERVVGYMGAILDVTDQRELEEQLRQSQKMEAIGRLAGGVAHDFNNLLTVIQGYVALLQETQPSDELDHVQSAADRAAALTRQLLAFSRQAVVKLENVDLNDVVARTAALIDRVIGEDVVMRLELGHGTWPIKADPGQLQQVLMNLAVNARDAMPDGGPLTVGTANVSLDEAPAHQPRDLLPGDYVVLTVEDRGEGMEPAIVARIFEPFFTTKGQDKGTGLGLATVFGIAAQSGGTVEVSSQPGEGTRFSVYIPRASD